MRHPRFQFTLRLLIVLIAVCGVSFALLRTPFGFIVVYVGAALPGFLIGRARGGSGIIAGAISESAVLGLLTVGLIVYDSPRIYSGEQALAATFGLTILVAGFAFVFGLLVSAALFVVFQLAKLLIRERRPDKSSHAEEIRWLDQDERLGEHR